MAKKETQTETTEEVVQETQQTEVPADPHGYHAQQQAILGFKSL